MQKKADCYFEQLFAVGRIEFNFGVFAFAGNKLISKCDLPARNLDVSDCLIILEPVMNFKKEFQ